jgi:hypothetical protein
VNTGSGDHERAVGRSGGSLLLTIFNHGYSVPFADQQGNGMPGERLSMPKYAEFYG